MAVRYKICVDCADPHRLAAFWAAALDYVVEDHSALVRRLLDASVVTDADVVTVDGRLAWRTAAGIRDPDDPVDPQSGVGRGSRVLFQQVPEPGSRDIRTNVAAEHLSAPKTSKNRLHLDLHVGPERQAAVVARLTELGATYLWTGAEGGSAWVTMADPEGNEFCVA